MENYSLMLENSEIKKIITLDTFNDTSLFAVSVIDLENYTVIYANQAMKNIMADLSAKNCWESIHGLSAPCMWCKASTLQKKAEHDRHTSQTTINSNYIIYENFNEIANRWYQLQEKVVKLSDGKDILISFALDISIQKEAQSKLIETHVKLNNQTNALKEAQEKLKELANKDSLTNLYNRRYFSEIAKNIIELSKKERASIGVLMIDIDNFKPINDTYGHNVGDEVIKSLANILVAKTRVEDVVSRIGGEEFVVLLINSNIEDSKLVAQEIVNTVQENITIVDDIEIKYTISIGVDEFDYDLDKDIDKTIIRADKALYRAKNSGKNRVEVL